MLEQKRQAPRAHPSTVALQESRLQRRGHSNLNAELFKKLYFSTSSKTAFPDHSANQSDLKEAAQPSMNEMKALCQGAPRVQSQARAPQRSDCTYAHQYHQMPLDSAPVNNQLRELIAVSSRTGSNKVVEGLSLSSVTTTRACYGSYGDKPARIEQAPIVKPEGYMRINSDARFLESKSVFQRDFRWQHDLQNINRKENGKSLDHLGGKQAGKFEDMTSYRREFGKDRPPRHPGLPKSQSVDALRAMRAREAAIFSGR
jgi:hypothetical protein